MEANDPKIPEDLQQMYVYASMKGPELNDWATACGSLIERIADLQAKLEEKDQIIAALKTTLTEIHGFAIYGCGTKSKDVRGKQFSAIEELARPFSDFISRAASRSQEAQKGASNG